MHYTDFQTVITTSEVQIMNFTLDKGKDKYFYPKFSTGELLKVVNTTFPYHTIHVAYMVLCSFSGFTQKLRQKYTFNIGQTNAKKLGNDCKF